MWQSKREISRECNDIIGSAKGSQISEKYWGEVGKGKRVDVYLEVRKRRGHIFFECNKCLWGEHSIFSQRKHWHDRKRLEKEANIVKGARFCYCRIYHKFVNFFILNLFKVVKWKSFFSLLRGILVRWYGSQINAPNYTKSQQTLTR